MDPVTGVSLAASVIQLVKFSIDSIQIIREVYESGSVGKHDNTAYTANHLAALTRSLQKTLQSSGKQSLTLSKDERDLLDLSQKCQDCALKLQLELGKLQSQPRSSVLAATLKAARAIWTKRKIEEIRRRLEAYRSTLETSLLHRLSQRFEVQRLRNDECFAKLDQSLQHLILGLAESRTSLATLMVQEPDQTRAHITSQSQRLEQICLDYRFYDEVVKSLFYPDIYSRQEQVDQNFDGIEDSYQWIFHKPQVHEARRHEQGTANENVSCWSDFAIWLKSGHGAYWVNGKAGSGKSTLMSYVCQNSRTVDLLKHWSIDRVLLTPTYFFWAAGSKMQNTVEGLLRSLIYQMLIKCHELVHCIETGPLHTWNKHRLLTLLLNILRQSRFPIATCMFIDGLDEIDGDYYSLLALIEDLVDLKNVKICLSSRPLPAFERAFGVVPSLRLQDLTYGSIRAYADTQLSDLIQRRVDKRDIHRVKHLVDVVVDRANGVFLWAVIATRDIRDGLRDFVDLNELTQTVDHLPSQLESLFMLMLNRIKPAYQRDAAHFLQFALYLTNSEISCSSLTLCILYFIQCQKNSGDGPFAYDNVATSDVVEACRTLRTRLLSHTAGLLDLTSSSDGACTLHDTDEPLLHTRITFLHRTARDFVHKNEQAKSFLARKGFTEAEVHILIARGVLSHLAQLSAQTPFDGSEKGPVYSYRDFNKVLQHIAVAEKSIGAAQHGLMQSLDYGLCVQKPVVFETGSWCRKVQPDHQKPFMVDNDTSLVDVVGMAAAAGMTVYVCDRLNIPHASRKYALDRPYVGQLGFDRSSPATMVWSEPRLVEEAGRDSAFLQASDYRQTLRQFLHVKSDAANPPRRQSWASNAFAESYLLACCEPTSHDLVQALLRAGANPMVNVTNSKEDKLSQALSQAGLNPMNNSISELLLGLPVPLWTFWHQWLVFLRKLRWQYMNVTQRSGGFLLSDRDRDLGLTEKYVLDTTIFLLARGVDVNQTTMSSNSEYYKCYSKPQDFEKNGFEVLLEATAMFTLEECFGKEPEFCKITDAISSSTQRPTRWLVRINPPPRHFGNSRRYDRPSLSLSAENCGMLWPLIEKWERSGHAHDLKALESTVERMWRDNNPEMVVVEAANTLVVEEVDDAFSEDIFDRALARAH